MMYAVVLQNAAEGQRLEDYERRIANQQQQAQEEEDEEEEEAPAEEAQEEADPSVSHHTEHPQNSDLQSLLEQPAANLEAEIDRSLENVNNQLSRNFAVSLRRDAQQQEGEEGQQSSLVQEIMERTVETNVQQQQQ